MQSYLVLVEVNILKSSLAPKISVLSVHILQLNHSISWNLSVTTRLVPGYYVGGGTVCDRTLDQEQVGRAGGCILPSPQTIPVELFT